MGNGGPARVTHGTREAESERQEENPEGEETWLWWERGQSAGALRLTVCVCVRASALVQVFVSAQGSVMDKVIATKCV